MYWQVQNQCLHQRNINKDEIVFQTFIEGQRMFSCISDKDEFARYILSKQAGSQYCNELLFTDTFGYCDLDCKQTLEELGFNEETFIQAFNNVLIKCHKKDLGVDIQNCDIFWLKSSRPSKTSFHVKIQCPYYWKVEERKVEMKDFFRFVEVECGKVKGLHWYEETKGKLSLCTVVDLAVYSNNRCMRAAGCSKPDIEVQLLPLNAKLTHSTIVQNLLTVTAAEKNRMKPFVLKSKCKIVSNPQIDTHVLHAFAQKFGAKFVGMKGNIGICKNVGTRLCPIGGEQHQTDNCFFVIKQTGIFFGCHHEHCTKLLKVHEIEATKKYLHYDDYKLLLENKNITITDVYEYMTDTINFIDKPSDPFFVTTSKSAVACLKNRISCVVTNSAKTLFKNYSDLYIQQGEEEPLKFGKILQGMLRRRLIPTYQDTVWRPFLGKKTPDFGKLNLFQGFVLEQLPKNSLDFEKSQMYDLLQRLCGHSKESLLYLLNFIAYKLQNPADKKPIALCFINSREGVGKGTFGEFLSRLFFCGTNSWVAFNNLTSFANSFNGIKSKALWICLEEVSAKRNCLREYNGFLKDQISSCVILEEIKNKERTLRPWYASIVIFSNEFNVMSCSRTDRRLVFFESDNSKANNKEYFVALHKELDSLEFLKSAFDYFSTYDTSQWNYRAIPKSTIKDKLAKCSEKNVTKFHRFLFKECFAGATTYTFDGHQLYCHYRDFCELYGVQKRSDRSYVCSNLELYVKMTKIQDTYTLTNKERQRYLAEIKE